MSNTPDTYPAKDLPTTPADIIDPETTTFCVAIIPLFNDSTLDTNESTLGTMRIGAVGDITVERPDGEDKETKVNVDLYIGDTSNHTPLLKRAGMSSPVIDMPEDTGCTEATVSITAEPGARESQNFSEAIIGAKMLEITGGDPAALEEQEQNVQKFLEAVGRVTARASLLPLESEEPKEPKNEGSVITFMPGDQEEPSGVFYLTVTADSPDTADES